MDCPVCKEPMIVLELDEVEVDFCLDCRGIWLDAGELELLLGNEDESNQVLAGFKPDTGSTETRRNCPICSKKMEKVSASAEGGLCIDRCTANDGLWFDAGELHDIVRTGTIDKDSKVLKLLEDMFGMKK
jgi:Zn-finger nucleic acid-binding protein